MQKLLTEKVAFIMMISLVSLLCAPVIHAQVHSQPPSVGQSTQQSQPRKDVSDKELQTFAKAYVEVQKIKESHQVSLKNAQDPEQVQKLQQEITSEMTKAIEKQGLTPEAYTQMLAAINSDNALNKKAFDLIQKERAK
jgi:transcription initiation factor IIF auxiliary subunit